MDLHFTPSPEDIHIGYECEYEQERWKYEMEDGTFVSLSTERSPRNAERFKETYIHQWAPIKIGNEYDLSYVFKQKAIRTAYLTEDQLKQEGWIQNDGTWTKGDFVISAIINLLRDGSRRKQSMGINRKTQTVYVGEVRCINDLRRISKLIGV